MIIKLDKKQLVFWAKDLKEEKVAEKIRHLFDKNDFNTDRVWKYKNSKKPLGVRVFLT